jgi:hypothetical protein
VTTLYRVAFWAALILTLVMALMPHPPRPVSSDKLQHAAAFVTLAAAGALAYRSVSALRWLAALSAFGALIEVLQAIPVLHRDSDPLDWVTDTVAAAVVLAIVYWLRRRRETPNPCPPSD